MNIIGNDNIELHFIFSWFNKPEKMFKMFLFDF